jgi:hypothetical protein
MLVARTLNQGEAALEATFSPLNATGKALDHFYKSHNEMRQLEQLRTLQKLLTPL